MAAGASTHADTHHTRVHHATNIVQTRRDTGKKMVSKNQYECTGELHRSPVVNRTEKNTTAPNHRINHAVGGGSGMRYDMGALSSWPICLDNYDRTNNDIARPPIKPQTRV